MNEKTTNIADVMIRLDEAKDMDEYLFARWLVWMHIPVGWKPDCKNVDYVDIAKSVYQIPDRILMQELRDSLDETSYYGSLAELAVERSGREFDSDAEAEEWIYKKVKERINRLSNPGEVFIADLRL